MLERNLIQKQKIHLYYAKKHKYIEVYNKKTHPPIEMKRPVPEHKSHFSISN